jgi:hypothetical protein
MTLRALSISVLLMLPTAGWSQTFHRDVLPIIQKNCQGCHRQGEIAPMSLMTFDEVRPWAKAIRTAVLTRAMPPWHADPHYADFANDRRLTDAEIKTIVSWVDAGAPQGKPGDAPPPRVFVEGWTIGQPDAVVKMLEAYKVGASGSDEYMYFAVPTNFSEDLYVQSVEIRPGNRRVVHHVLAYAQPGGSSTPSRAAVEAYNKIAGANLFRAEGLALRVNDDPPAHDDACSLPNGGSALSGDLTGGRRPLIGVYVPGGNPTVLPHGVVQKIPAGSEILFQIHYSKSGKEESDQTSIGFVFSKEPPEKMMGNR